MKNFIICMYICLFTSLRKKGLAHLLIERFSGYYDLDRNKVGHSCERLEEKTDGVWDGMEKGFCTLKKSGGYTRNAG